MIALIYWIGVIVAFILLRIYRHKETEEYDPDWGMFLVTTILCFLSWFMVMVTILGLLLLFTEDNNSKPPKWL